MSVYLDNFNADAGWVKAGSWVDSTYSISGGVMTMTPGAGGAGSSAWKKDGLDGRNASITVRAGAAVNGYPQVHLRETDASNYLVGYIDPTNGTLNIGKVVAGVYTSFASVAITSFSTNSTYTFTVKVWENLLFAAYLRTSSDFDVGGQIEEISSDVSNFTGTTHGIGVTTGTQKYDWVDMRILDSFTAVVCVGDSNVGADNRLFWPNQMMKRRFNEGFRAENQGQGGWSTQDILDNLATRVDPFPVQKADNVLSIATGNNDYAVDAISPTTCHTRQGTLMTYAKTLGYRCELATLIPFPYVDRGGYVVIDWVTELNTLIRDGASSEGYTLVEIHDAFGATDGQYGVNPSNLVNADQIHYSSTAVSGGHTLAARTHLHTIANRARNPVT